MQPTPYSWCSLIGLASVLTGCTITGTIQEILDTTTNVTVSTSGRTWWNEDGLLKADHKALAFAAYNQANVEQDIAKGRGEYLDALSVLIGVSEGRKSGFALGAQTQFRSLIAADDAARLQLLRTLLE
ncbi:MAG TPA: DUF3015 family protein [Nitrospira sp.]|nr:DUF3015 family protein [Nitrospira sp.]